MKSAAWNPRRLDVAAFAKTDAALDGMWPVRDLPRLADCAVSPPSDAVTVRWSAQGARHAPAGESAQTWLHLQATVDLPLQCQRCLEPVDETLRVDRHLRFVAGEAQAALLDADSDDDVLPLSAALDLQALVEDELLLVLPIVPRHGTCPQPLQAPDLASSEAAERVGLDHPFAALERLRQGKPPIGSE